jgi:hypothetical protein
MFRNTVKDAARRCHGSDVAILDCATASGLSAMPGWVIRPFPNVGEHKANMLGFVCRAAARVLHRTAGCETERRHRRERCNDS